MDDIARPPGASPAGERVSAEPTQTLDFLMLESAGLRSTAEMNRLRCEIAVATVRRVAVECFMARSSGSLASNDARIRDVPDATATRMEPHLLAASLKCEARTRLVEFQAARKRMAQAVEQAQQNLNAALDSRGEP